MAGLWLNDPETPEGKYLVQRRDGTVPKWPHFVMGAADKASQAGLLAYADKAEELGYDPQYVFDVRELAGRFAAWFEEREHGDPDAPRHRKDDPEIVAKMRQGRGS